MLDAAFVCSRQYRSGRDDARRRGFLNVEGDVDFLCRWTGDASETGPHVSFHTHVAEH